MRKPSHYFLYSYFISSAFYVVFLGIFITASVLFALCGGGVLSLPADEQIENDENESSNTSSLQEVAVSHISKRHTPHNGHFKVYVKYARNLPDTDGWWNRPDPYVRITAIKSSGARYTKTTHYIQGTQNPDWNTWLDWQDHGCNSWTHFEVEVMDDDVGSDDLMFPKRQFDVEPGSHYNVKHCVQTSCSGYLLFNHYLYTDRDDCSPNPCRNGGTCIDGCRKYTCYCTNSYGGPQCQYRIGNLQIYARYGSGLQNRDLVGKSDPYMQVVAEDQNGHRSTLKTPYDREDQSPEWYVYLHFGTRMWKKFTVRLYDDDTGSDDTLSSPQTINLPSRAISVTNVHHPAYGGGSAYFDYTFN